MNFSSISEETFLGKMLRLPLRLIPANMRLPIMQGRLQGKLWVVGAGTHGYWLGSYESEKQGIFGKYVRAGSVVYDIGAHTGYYTLLASTLAGAAGRVVAFEPLPRNIHYLREHLRINHVTNVQVIPVAVGDRSGTAHFSEGESSFQGRLSADGGIEVPAVSLDELWEKKELPLPDVVKIDVEGAEFLVLSGAERLLQANHPVIFLATHGVEVRNQCEGWLKDNGYRLFVMSSPDEILALPREKVNSL